MGQNNGLGAKTSKRGIRITKIMDLQEIFPYLIRIVLSDQTSHMGTTIRKLEDHMINAQISHLIKTMEIDLEMDLSTMRNGTGETVANFLVPSTQRRDFLRKSSYRQTRSNQLNNSAFHRSDIRPTTGCTPYDQKFPQNNMQMSFNVVRFTITDDTKSELSDLCPLNY